MRPEEAIDLIKFRPEPRPQQWADLGCGTGVFTLALASKLVRGSGIYAVDRELKALEQIPRSLNGVSIHKMNFDFTDDIELPALDGVLMANALHYVEDQQLFLQKLTVRLKPGGIFLLVEYDRDDANPWVPFPLPERKARKLFSILGFQYFTTLNRRPSAFGDHEIYAAMIMENRPEG